MAKWAEVKKGHKKKLAQEEKATGDSDEENVSDKVCTACRACGSTCHWVRIDLSFGADRAVIVCPLFVVVSALALRNAGCADCRHHLH